MGFQMLGAFALLRARNSCAQYAATMFLLVGATRGLRGIRQPAEFTTGLPTPQGGAAALGGCV